MHARWQIRLLGTLEARQEDVVLSRFTTSRVASLLARLALFPRAHSREELAGTLWPDADADAGRLNLRVALLSLRRQMEPPGVVTGSILITDRNSIQLNPQACVCDAVQFEAALRDADRAASVSRKRDALCHAVSLYGGELLPGFYDEWILEERDRLEALCEEAKSECSALPASPLSVANDVEVAGVGMLSPLLSAPMPPTPMLGFPGQFTRFFGRTAERARLLEKLADPEVRLVTLLGPGGAGKTRLALETARRAAESFDGLVCFVPLADTGDSALIASTIATALRMPLAGDRSPLDQVASHLAPARSLLVLDNLEHLGEGAAPEIRALLDKAPLLTCLVTSRQTLNLEGEQEVLLSPLPVPASEMLPASEAESLDLPLHLTSFPSVQLFVDRAQAVRPDFQITRHNAEAVAAVCRSLEGLPLALELAAARIQTLTPGQMQQQLEARLDFLTSRRRDLPARHQSLRAALEWSAHLLTPEQTVFFTRLSIFRGGWSSEAAAAVCRVPNPLELLEQLCERSLISALETPLGMRFRMLESMREFGAEQLTPDEQQALARRHAHYFQHLAARMDALWSSPQQNQAQETLDAEQDNLRAALTFCRTEQLDTGGDKSDWNGSEVGLRLAAKLGNYWTVRGLLREGIDWLEGALAGRGSEAARAGALAAAGWLVAGLGEYPRAEALLSEAIDLSRDVGDPAALALALRMRGVAGIWHNNYPLAACDLEEALTLSREIGDEVMTAIILNSLGVLTYQWQGDKIGARALYEEALALFLKGGDQQRASYCLHNLGCIAHEFADYERAGALLRQSLTISDSLGDLWHRAYCLRSLGEVLREEGDLPGAVDMLQEGCALCRSLGDRMSEAGTSMALAVARRRQQDWAQASAAGRSALLLYQAMGHAAGAAQAWMNLAETAAAQEKWEEVAALLSAAAACRDTPPAGEEFQQFDALYQSALTALSPPLFEVAWTRGSTLACDEYGLR